MIEIYETPTGWRWRVKGKNGEIVASGEAYTTRMAALEGVATLGRILHEKPEIQFIETRPTTRRVQDTPQA